MDGDSRHVHATAIAVDGVAALLFGPSGSGKSDLALRCLMQPWTDGGGRPLKVRLLADDQVLLRASNGLLYATPPPAIAGRIEVRGLGVLPFEHIARDRVGLAVSLAGPAAPERFPDPHPVHVELGVGMPLVRVSPFEASAPAKVVLALARIAATGTL